MRAAPALIQRVSLLDEYLRGPHIERMPLLPLPRPVVFPLFGIVDGKCACGNESCSRIGKHPQIAWGEIEYGSEVPLPAPGAGAGIKTGAGPRGSGVFVVDLDSDAALDTWETLGGSDATFTVTTPRGWHLYFQHPKFPVKNSAGALGKGIDVRGEGGFVVAPGSPHASGGRYEADEHVHRVFPAPAWLLTWLAAQKAPAEIQTYAGDVAGVDREHRRKLFTEYLKKAPPSVAHAGGDEALWKVVQYGAYDLALPVADVLELVRAVFDPRCSPPWGDELEERVVHKSRSAKTSSTRPRLEPLPAELAHLAVQKGGLSVTAGQAPQLDKSASADPAPEASERIPEGDSRIAEFEDQLKITWGRWNETFTPPPYLVAQIVPEDTVGMLVAKGSSLKTWIILSIAGAVATGKPWLGFFETKKARALIIDFESGTSVLRERVQILQQAEAADLGHASFPSLQVDDPEFWRLLAHVCVARGVRLVAIDSFSAGTSDVDENDARASAPLKLAATFTEATKGCAVLFVHHGKKGDGGDERDVGRGSGAIFAACDYQFVLSPQNEERTKMLVHCNKPFQVLPKDFRIVFSVGEGLKLDIDQEAAPELRHEQIKHKIRAMLARGPVATRELFENALGKRKDGASSAALDAMVVNREVVKLPGKGYCLDSPPLRLARVREAVQLPKLGTLEKLARAAFVDVEELQQLQKLGQLFCSGGGFVLVGGETRSRGDFQNPPEIPPGPGGSGGKALKATE